MPALLPALPFLATTLVLAILLLRLLQRLRRIEAEAMEDPLTSLPNRRALARHWAARTPPGVLLLLDLVGFKAVNDGYGHIVGDSLLRAVALRLHDSLSDESVLVRWGGDEFAAIVPSARAAATWATLQQALAAPFDLSAAGGPPAVSIGIRSGASNGEADLAAAEAAAARALLAAKADEDSGKR